MKTFNMDQYMGTQEYPESYHFFMWNNFFKHINPENTQAGCDAFEKTEAAGWIKPFVGDLGTLPSMSQAPVWYLQPG
jgi:glucosamine-6-phosphate deaminase